MRDEAIKVAPISPTDVISSEVRQFRSDNGINSDLHLMLKPTKYADSIKAGGVVSFQGRFYEVKSKNEAPHTTDPTVSLILSDICSINAPERLRRRKMK